MDGTEVPGQGKKMSYFLSLASYFLGPTNDGVTSIERQANKDMAELISLPSLSRSIADEASYLLQRKKDLYTAAG